MSIVDSVERFPKRGDTGSGERICVVGAGASGIAMCRSLAVRGIRYDCFERAPAPGGLWRYPTAGGGTCSYDALFSNTSKTVMQYPSYPMPEDYPHYPHHTLVARYFDDFVDHFGLRDSIHLDAEVRSVRRADGGGWEVELADGAVHEYSAVAVASGGRHAEPELAAIPGEFDGRQLHAFDYDAAADFAGQHVVVLGLGASGADIASELSTVAARTYLSVRTGHYVVPKLIRGHPIDKLSPLMRRLSVEQRRPLLTLMLRLVNGDMTAYGLPKPPYKPGQGPLVATHDLLPAIAHGRIVAKPTVVRLDGRAAVFADGSTAEVDAVVHCTGYRIAFPFLDNELVSGGDDAPPLYHLVVPPDVDGLYFIGLIHSMMALTPLAEAQAEWVADLITGAVELPSRATMWSTIRRARRRQDRRFYDTSGHLLVDPNEYERLIARERREQRARGRMPLTA